MNKKGFTLIELLAVMVILIIVILIALTRVRKTVDKSADQAIIANAGVVIKAVNAAASNVNIMQTTPLREGVIDVSQFSEYGVSITGTKPDAGYVLMTNFEVKSSCLVYDGYKVEYSNGNFTDPVKGTCVTPNLSGTYAYTGDVQTFNVTINGTYKLEVWGAQGGQANDNYIGGYGGYAVGDAYLTAGTKLYINVGGKGESGCLKSSCAGGYNGGGNSYQSGDNSNYQGGGGGATSITKVDKTLPLITDASDIYIVAGGGAGGYYHTSGVGYSTNGGNAGGYLGNKGNPVSYTSNSAGGGTQTNPGTAGYNGGAGSFGKGSSHGATSAGGGGGYYGGGSAAHAGAGGGSGFTGNYKLDNTVMNCVDCTSTDIYKLNTEETSCVDETATANCAKLENGFAKITFISEQDKTKASEYKYLYSAGEEFTSVTGGWTGTQGQSRGRFEKGPGYLRLYYSSKGESESYFKSNNNIDITGYSMLNVIYEIVSTADATSEFSCLRTDGITEYTTISEYKTPGVYQEKMPLKSTITEGKLKLIDYDVDIRILQVYLSKS